MSNRCAELYVAHTLSTYDRTGDFYAALVAHDAFIANPFILATVTFIIFFWAKDFLVKKPVLLASLSAIIDCFWLGYFAR